MPIDKAELIALLADPVVRAALLEAMEDESDVQAARAALAESDERIPLEQALAKVAPAPAFTGPAWLKDRAHGPHTAKRFSAGS